MNNDDLFWIQNWYRSQCNGDWEHEFGITIATVDNPGWYVTINLTDTNLAGVLFEKVKEEKDEFNWHFCLIRNNNFEASCGPCNLNKILNIFRQWAEKVQDLS